MDLKFLLGAENLNTKSRKVLDSNDIADFESFNLNVKRVKSIKWGFNYTEKFVKHDVTNSVEMLPRLKKEKCVHKLMIANGSSRNMGINKGSHQ
jgi:hypothetical protein